MTNSIRSGLLAATAAIALPLLICGMGRRTSAASAAAAVSPSSSAAPTAAISQPSPSQRRVQEIIVHENQPADVGFHDESQMVTVSIGGTDQEMPLHDYLTGVLMGEMPASFSMEALKAQAVAARTYTLHRLADGGVLSDDPTVCQAFIPLENAQEKLGSDWERLLAKLHDAVSETDGLVLTYQGQLISATYFSGSGGKTESAQAVWGSEIPYLLSVDSPGEEETSDYESTVTVPLPEFLSTLGIDDPGVSSVSYTTGGGVDAIVIGGSNFTGLELRKLFGLRSTRFSMTVTEDSVLFDVLGNGHRVGLSQCGAEAMARNGNSFEEILCWYYSGVTLEPYTPSVE